MQWLSIVLAIVSSTVRSPPPTVTIPLRNGIPVRIRPLTAGDRDQLVRAFAGLSETARYQRFFTPVSHLSTSQLDYLTDIDHIDHFAWGVETTRGEGIAIARYVRTSAADAEAAFVVDASSYFNRSGPRVVDGIEILSTLLHPKSFPDVDLTGRGTTWQPPG